MLLYSILLLCTAGYTQANCFGKDAGFSPANGKPSISQPSRSDPGKVMVEWSKIVKNPDCVDTYSLLVWADGTPPTGATRYSLDKNTKSKIVDVQPCVGYRFAVETNEKNTLGTKTEKSGDELFRTAGAPQTISPDASKFHVTYHWDPVKKVVDLRQATISIPRDLLPGASCLDYIQVTGSQVRSTARSGSSSPAKSRTFSWGHLGENTFNPNIQVGGASTLPASTGGISYSGAVKGATPPRGPLAQTYSTSSSGSSSPYNSPPGSPTAGRAGSAITFPSPNYSNALPRATGGATNQVGPIKIQPPFLNPIIEINIAVQDCSEYDFEIKFFAPGSKEVGKVSHVKLPPLADVPGYIPPPITSVMSITYGSNGKPVYGVKTSSGVTEACLPSYFEAYDSYTHRLENEVNFQLHEGKRVTSLVSNSQNQLSKSQEELLRKTGCVCTSSILQFSTTDNDLLKKYREQFGIYEFQGMHNEHPFYKLTSNDINAPVPNIPTGTTTSRPSITTTTVRTPTTLATMFLFWDAKEKQWMFTPTLGKDSKIEFGSVTNSLAKCPGDPPAASNWQYKSSVLGRWKKSADLKVACQVRI